MIKKKIDLENFLKPRDSNITASKNKDLLY